MAETSPEPNSEAQNQDAVTSAATVAAAETVAILEAGPISKKLAAAGHSHEFLGVDHLGVEMIKVEADQLLDFATALLASGYNYLQCQGGYDVGPGADLVSMYHLLKLSDEAQQDLEELRIKVFLPRDNPRVPSLYWIWKASDWQERESYDMYGIVYEGHPCLKRLLMPEDWVGWPLRKDYISPDFYELQDAY